MHNCFFYSNLFFFYFTLNSIFWQIFSSCLYIPTYPRTFNLKYISSYLNNFCCVSTDLFICCPLKHWRDISVVVNDGTHFPGLEYTVKSYLKYFSWEMKNVWNWVEKFQFAFKVISFPSNPAALSSTGIIWWSALLHWMEKYANPCQTCPYLH